MSHSHSIAHLATSTIPCHRLIALHVLLHLLQHCRAPQHCTLLHICQGMPCTYSIAPAVVIINCIMGTQHCTPQHDQPQVTPHALSITHGTASIRLCHRPTTLHTALQTALHTATFPYVMPHTHYIAHDSILTRGHPSEPKHCILHCIHLAMSCAHSIANHSIAYKLCLIP